MIVILRVLIITKYSPQKSRFSTTYPKILSSDEYNLFPLLSIQTQSTLVIFIFWKKKYLFIFKEQFQRSAPK
jgi:hypothetical protein